MSLALSLLSSSFFRSVGRLSVGREWNRRLAGFSLGCPWMDGRRRAHIVDSTHKRVQTYDDLIACAVLHIAIMLANMRGAGVDVESAHMNVQHVLCGHG